MAKSNRCATICGMRIEIGSDPAVRETLIVPTQVLKPEEGGEGQNDRIVYGVEQVVIPDWGRSEKEAME